MQRRWGPITSTNARSPQGPRELQVHGVWEARSSGPLQIRRLGSRGGAGRGQSCSVLFVSLRGDTHFSPIHKERRRSPLLPVSTFPKLSHSFPQSYHTSIRVEKNRGSQKLKTRAWETFWGLLFEREDVIMSPRKLHCLPQLPHASSRHHCHWKK